MTYAEKRLFELKDEKYAAFQSGLIPTLDKSKILGVRTPSIRALAKEMRGSKDEKIFLSDLPHKYYDENILHAVLISEIKDTDAAIKAVDDFLPHIDNWAVCDILTPKIFKKYPDKVLTKIKEWSGSKETYTCRFGLEMLMSFYLDENFKREYLEIPAHIRSEEYYINMMIAWFFATALAKQWSETIKYLQTPVLDKWTHNKAIQKARESYRITPEQKEYLKTLKI